MKTKKVMTVKSSIQPMKASPFSKMPYWVIELMDETGWGYLAEKSGRVELNLSVKLFPEEKNALEYLDELRRYSSIDKNNFRLKKVFI